MAEPQVKEVPDIMTFAARPSDRFIVNLDQVLTGHPFMGERSRKPHAGAHVHFDNALFKDAGKAEDYPPIYAPVDGIITRVDYCFPLSSSTGMCHDRYGLDLSFAKDKEDGSLYSLAYSIEPMVLQPSADFYRRFILVSEGQRVKKGDIIAYMYVPPRANGTHVHFDINNFPKHRDHKMAPALFTPEVVQRFYETWRGESSMDGDTPIPRVWVTCLVNMRILLMVSLTSYELYLLRRMSLKLSHWQLKVEKASRLRGATKRFC